MATQEVAQPDPVSFLTDLYFVRAGDAVKIGRSKRVAERVRVLQSGSAVELKMLGVLKGRGWEERLWHKALEDARLSGEWFEWSAPLAEAISFAKEDGPWWEKLPTPSVWCGGWDGEVGEHRDEWIEHMDDAIYEASLTSLAN